MEEQVFKNYNFLSQGKSNIQLAKEAGCSVNDIIYWRKEFNIQADECDSQIYKSALFLSRPDANTVLADEAGVDEATIRYWRKKHRIDKDGKSLEQDSLLGDDDKTIIEMIKRGYSLQKARDQNTQLRKEIRELSRFEAGNQIVLDNILEEFSNNIKISEIVPFSKNTRNIKQENIWLSDFHFGKKTNGLVGARDYCVDVAKERMERIASDLLSRGTNHLNITIMGDLVENLVPEGMHPNSKDHCELSAFEQIKFAEEQISKLLTTLLINKKTLTVRCIPGNHDRVGRDKKADSVRLGGLVIYHMIGIRMREWIEKGYISYTFNEGKKVLTFVDNNIGYIVYHGDEKFSFSRAIDLYSDSDEFQEWRANNPRKRLYLCVVHGDKHHHVADDPTKGSFILTPSICGADEYAQKDLALSSPAGYIVSGNAGENEFYHSVYRLS